MYTYTSTTSDYDIEDIDIDELYKAFGGRKRAEKKPKRRTMENPKASDAEVRGHDIDSIREQLHSPMGSSDEVDFYSGYDAPHPGLFEDWLTFDQIREIAQYVLVISSIIETRVAQIRNFCVPDTDNTSVGFSIVPRDSAARVTREMRRKAAQITDWIMSAGIASQYTGNLETFDSQTAQYMWDSLVYDWCAYEVPTTRKGVPVAFIARDPSTIRLAVPTAEERRKGMRDPRNAGYFQVINGKKVAAWLPHEMMTMVRRRRTNIRTRRYGVPEITEIMGLTNDLVSGEAYNANNFRNGTQARGVFKVKARMSKAKFRAWNSYVRSQMHGVENSNKFASIKLDPGENQDLEFIDLTKTNKDMEYMEWLKWLTRQACNKYLMDPSEIGLNLGVDGQSSTLSSQGPRDRLIHSRERGLFPVVRQYGTHLNEALIYRLDERFKLKFIGLDDKDTKDQQDRRIAALSNYKGLNEARKEEGLEELPPLIIPGTDVDLMSVPLNSTLQQNVVAVAGQIAAQQQEEGQGGEEGEPQDEPTEDDPIDFESKIQELGLG